MTKPATTTFIPRPPIVTVLGHVDHGKTTLLDRIRKTNIATKEFGGITQHIGAYQMTVSLEGEQSSRAIRQSTESRGIPSESAKPSSKRILRQAQDDRVPEMHTITFIDTPGHEAFAKMRSRGAKVADIAILVVAANDGVMPQTLESIEHIKAAKIHSIVAVNKIDLPDVNLEKIKKQLTKAGLSLEEYGGETPIVPISAKTGQGVDKLLEMILLVAELNQIREESPNILQAVVIESTLSKNRGCVAWVVVRSGSLTIGEEVVCEDQEFRIRALYNWQGKLVKQAVASEPMEILGWKKLPPVGSLLHAGAIAPLPTSVITQSLTIPADKSIEEEKIKLILKADTVGTLEAIMAGIGNNIEIIYKGVGNITESDVLLAKTTHAFIIGFHQQPEAQVVKLAASEKVVIKTYNIIYELLDEITEVVDAFKKGNLVTVLGEASVVTIFNIKDKVVAGVKVVSGRIARGDQVKVMRQDQEIGRAKIKSLRHLKEDITRAEQGSQAGVQLTQKLDILTGDSIISIG